MPVIQPFPLAPHVPRESPTPTPYPTRSGTPSHGVLVCSPEPASFPIAKLEKLARTHGKQVPVNISDGSATVPAITKLKYLAVYFAFNLGLTLFNKAVMIQFPYPFLLTALHACSSSIGTHILNIHGVFTPTRLSNRDVLLLYAFSILYTANIAISNVSLALVTVPFHQVLRATTPVFIIAIYRIIFDGTYSLETYFSLIPVIVGVGFATYGDYYATTTGFFLTLLGAIVAAIKTVTTNRLQTAGLHLNALELLHRMAPLAMLQALTAAYLSGEVSACRRFGLIQGNINVTVCAILAANGAIAFGLNLISFSANKKVGALTMTVAANVKQILALLLSYLCWKMQFGWMNVLGIFMTLIGGAWYSKVELAKKAAREEDVLMELEAIVEVADEDKS
ncbi:MAG: phosphate phosphoenolpyruvate translocator [Lasallia pustulata]|uniref:Phosphate phosphoenolpyruvate translocator n=1 Tax=Lasallia pustulata TaxID=136370 RepID=A0A5M8Q2F0_9LECA|nr:MAG: phosphate phosphoenolpyruvate translocator [Lasallia pustulata]